MKKLSLKVIFSVLFMSLFIVSVTKAQNIYVDSSATGANNGSSWADAYTSLKVALDYANLNTVDSVFVAKGTYYATTGTARDSSFNIKHDMVVMGGYPSGGGTRNWTANPTILSGDIGVQGDSTDNTYNVVHNTGMDTLGVIDGFTIEYGNATASTYPNNQGGGMLNENCSPKIQNVTFYRNTASFGGGMNCGNSYDAVLSNISFIDNTGIYDAGALSCTSSNLLRADHLTFTGNRAYTAGAVELSYCTSPTFTNVTFKNNTASLYQGGALFNSHASPIMSNVTFIQDTAGTDGGAIFNTSSSAPVITNAVFSGNSAVSGGAVYNSYCMLNISNSVFYQNYATDNGGAIYTVKGTDKLVNNTFEGNYITSTSADGGAVRLDSATETMNMSNCIFWANKFGTDSVSAGSDISVGGGTLHAVYNSFQTSVSGTGNMIGNPLFVNENNAIGTDNMWMTADDGLHLQCASSAINAGINDSVPVGLTTDISGMNRIMDSTVDMGAYENHGSTDSIMTVTACGSYTSPSGNHTWTTSGTYMDTIPNASGCDSVLTINLTIGNSNSSVQNVVACSSYTSPSGNYTWTTSGTYMDTISNASGCDSVMTIHLVIPPSNVLYVDSAAAGTNNGSSWTNAYTSLKTALDIANQCSSVDTILVAKGTYYATTGTARDSSFNIKHDMVVMGGYPSGGGTRNWTANPTILSGDIGVQGDSTDNTYNVVHNTGMDTLGVIDGFIIEYGNATASTYPNNQGGGMLNENCSPKIQNVVFYRNTGSFGGGMNCGNSYDAVLSDISFMYNTGIYSAGGLSCTSSNLLRADHLTFIGNSAYTAGGMSLSYCSSPTFTNVVFKNNKASLYQGGAVYNSHSSPNISNVTFIQDTAGTSGGAVFNTSSSAPVITNAVFSGNSAISGGAVYNSYCMLNISNSVFYQNYATDNGGAIYTVKGTDKLVNNTFEGNYITSTSADGGAVRLDSATETMNMSNCIFWANKFGTDSVSAGSDISVGGGTLHAVYNSFQTSVSGTGNMIGNPLFVNENNAIGTDNMWMTADDGLHLQCASSAINAGINDSVPVGLTTDISGMNRIMDSTVDMGAYENHGPTHSTMAVTTCSSYTSPSGHYTWTASGTYLDTIPNAAGCDSLMTIHLTIGAVDTSVTANADSLYANAGNATYQWLDCNNNDNPIAGATGQSYMPTANGSYAVIVTQGTCVDTSSCVNYTMTGINNITTNNYLKIYPNPSIGSITISSDLTGTYYLVNELGQQIEVIKLTNANNKTVNVSRLSNGIYTLVGYHGNRRISKRIVVTR